MDLWKGVVLILIGFMISHWALLSRALQVFHQVHHIQHKKTIAITVLIPVVIFLAIARTLNKIALFEKSSYNAALIAHKASRNVSSNAPRPMFRRSSFGPGHATIIKHLIKG
uniref:Uncharacterized protein n=1 Tax=Spongospora subterranea TaxID=70186 RepID=A0A0H5QIA9_9EUKA|eukprot:CRZ01362.1 hypothetical protein [Spongospora subterranea]